jgi:hypothetical protein
MNSRFASRKLTEEDIAFTSIRQLFRGSRASARGWPDLGGWRSCCTPREAGVRVTNGQEFVLIFAAATRLYEYPGHGEEADQTKASKRSPTSHSSQEIIQPAGSTRERTYQGVTRKTGGFASFKKLLDSHFPPGQPSGLTTDNPFPLRYAALRPCASDQITRSLPPRAQRGHRLRPAFPESPGRHAKGTSPAR